MAASPLISRWQLITREEDGGDTVVPTAPASYAPAARSAWLQRVGPRPAGPAPVDLDVRRGVDSWIAGVQSKVDDDVERMMEAELRGGLDPYSRSSDAAHVLQALANEQARSVGASLFANVAHRDTAPLFGARHGANKADEGGTGEEEEDVDAATMLSRAIDRELERITEDERTASSGASSASRGRGSGGAELGRSVGPFHAAVASLHRRDDVGDKVARRVGRALRTGVILALTAPPLGLDAHPGAGMEGGLR